MGSFTDGFEQFYKKLEDVKKLAPMAIDISLEETAKQCIEDTQKYMEDAIDTGTLFDSWTIREDNKQTGGYVDSTHSLEVWSDPSIINQNPKHKNNPRYYSHFIENGFLMNNGKYYRGKHMLKKAFSLCNKNLKANLKKNLKDVFNS